MQHLDLFSGIGGFALAARWSGFETVAFCEVDQYCQKVLAKHWPQVPIYSDIKKLTRQGLESDGISQPDIITGGFPCQPFSVAGKQRGQDDNRHLWPEMLRLISELHPAWVVGENVPGFVRLALDGCLSDLENQGYSVQSFIIPACAVDATHRRDRVWIIAHANSQREPVSPKYEQPVVDAHFDGQGLQGGPKARNFSPKPEKTRQQFTRQNLSPGRVDRPTQPPILRATNGIPHRMDRIKGLGNAVVPQLVYNLFQIIKQVDNNNDR